MTGAFGDHQLGIPYRPIAELFAMYRARDPGKTAIVDIDSGTAISFGQLDQVTTDVAAFLKSRGVTKGSRVLLLSDEKLEMTRALRLPTMDVAGLTLIKRLALIVDDARITHVFYPVFPPDRNAGDVLGWLKHNPKPS